MKFSTLVLFILLGVIGYKIWQLNAPAPPPAVAPVVAAPSPTPGLDRPQEWPRSALEVIHGKVAQLTPEGLSVVTAIVEPAQITTTRRVTAQMARDAEKKADEDDRKIFGPVMTMENGTSMHAASEIPSTKANGMLILKDYPNEQTIAPGTPINIVAAPLGNLHYTARFNTKPEAASSWRLNYKGIMDRE